MFEVIAKFGFRLFMILVGAGGWITAYFSTADLLEKLGLQQDVQKRLAVYYIIVLSFLVFCFLVYRLLVSDRKEKFANISPTMHAIVNNCKDLYSDLKSRQFAGVRPTGSEREQVLKDAQRKLREISDLVALVFAMLTSTHCRASIKVIVLDEERPYLLTLARDNSTHELYPLLDQQRWEDHSDPLAENSEFLRLSNDKIPTYVFFSNDLSMEKRFKCTSEAAYAKANSERKRNLLERIKGEEWVLPYRSTITVAIRNSADVVARGEPCVVGFLAVDSESRGVFSRRWDPHLCSLVAAALFHPINYLLELLGEGEEPTAAA